MNGCKYSFKEFWHQSTLKVICEGRVFWDKESNHTLMVTYIVIRLMFKSVMTQMSWLFPKSTLYTASEYWCSNYLQTFTVFNVSQGGAVFPAELLRL